MGAILSDIDLEEIEDGPARSAGLAFSYNLLSRRGRTERKIRQSLADEGVEKPAVIDYIVKTLRRQGYLNDLKYAAELLRYAKEVRMSGPRLVRRRMMDAGVDDETINSVMEEGYTGDEEMSIALRVAERRLQVGGSDDREKQVRRIHGLLSRRGFSSGVTNSICAGILRGDIPGDY